MPNVKVGAQLKDITAKGGKDYEDYQHYRCPCYKYAKRTDTYYIFDIKLRSEGSQNQHIWRLRGIAVLCSPP